MAQNRTRDYLESKVEAWGETQTRGAVIKHLQFLAERRFPEDPTRQASLVDRYMAGLDSTQPFVPVREARHPNGSFKARAHPRRITRRDLYAMSRGAANAEMLEAEDSYL